MTIETIPVFLIPAADSRKTSIGAVMKYTIEQITHGEDELILKYKTLSSEVENILTFIQKRQWKLSGKSEHGEILFSPDEILYIERVDDRIFAYTENAVIQLNKSLQSLETLLNDRKYFRCSKSMIVNIDKIKHLKSRPSNRIEAVMLNGEHIMISRTYASEFRKILRGEL